MFMRVAGEVNAEGGPVLVPEAAEDDVADTHATGRGVAAAGLAHGLGWAMALSWRHRP